MQNGVANLTFRKIYGGCSWSPARLFNQNRLRPHEHWESAQADNFYPLNLPLNININHHSSGGPCVVTRVASRFSQVAVNRWNHRLDVGVRKYGAFYHRIGW